MKNLVKLIQYIVGILFVFSGFVKLVDPIGSQYKFEEYFSESVLNIPFLLPYALEFAIVLIVAEIVLGIALLVRWKTKLTLYLLFLMIILFLFLTGYSAYFDKVTDCGCFGDAIKLTPWQTFYKDVILTVFIAFLIKYHEKIKPMKKQLLSGIFVLASLFISLGITFYVLNHLPIIDFRPYAIGKSIPEGMEYKGDGELPPVHDFFLEDEQNDLAPEILAAEKVVLVIAYDLDKSNLEAFKAIKELATEALQKNYKVYGVSSSFSDIVQSTKNKYDLPFNFLFGDGTTLKTMIRSNPGIIVLKKGIVTQKKNWKDIDEITLQ